MTIPGDIYDPCPCGSGKKFKFCCYLKNRETSKVSDFEWVKLRQTEGQLTEKLVKFASENIPKEVAAHIWDEFAVGQDFTLGDCPEFEPLFTPWFLFNWEIPERDQTIAALYLEKTPAVDFLERKFIEAIIQRPYSFYLVEATEPGVSLTLRGLLVPEDFTVKERQASQTVERGYIVFCRVLPMENVAIMVGCSPYLIPPNHLYGILDLRDRLKKRSGSLDLSTLHRYAPELRRIYFEFVEAIKNPKRPELRNTDGDPLLSAEIRYELKCPPGEAFDALNSLSLFQSEKDILEDATYDEKSELQSVSFDWMKAGNKAHAHWDNTVLGNIKINGSKLTIGVNSEKRAKEIQKEVEKRLGDKAVFQIMTYDSLEHHLKEGKGEVKPERQEELMNHPAVQAQMLKMMEEHWKNWYDQPIPALKGKTPRQAAKTKEGRERLEVLLTEYETRDRKSAKGNLLRPDIDVLRRELGLNRES
jgi:hypothetical protein